MSAGAPSRLRQSIVRGSAFALPGVVMLALGAWGLGRRSMFGSEADTYWAAHLSLPHLLRLLAHVDAVHGLYYLLMHGWFQLASGVTWLRVPSVLGMTAAAVVTSIVAIRLTGARRVGLLAGLLFALTPSISTWGQNGRSYALVCAAVAVMTLAFLRAVDAGDAVARRRWVAFGVSVTVCGYLNEMTLLLGLSFGITLVAAGVPRQVVRRWLVTTGVATALVTPLLLQSVRERAAVAWLRRPGWPALRTLFQQYFGTQWSTAILLAVLAAVAVLPVLRGPWRTGRITLPLLAAPMLVAPAGVLILESELRHPLYDPRYVLYSTIAASLLAASGADRVAGLAVRAARGRRRLESLAVVIPAAALCVAIVVQQWPDQQYLRTTASRREDYLAAAQFLRAHAVPGDALLFMNPSARSADLAYPADFRGLRDIAERRSSERSGTFRGIDRPDGAVLAAIRASDRIWVLGPYPLRRDPNGLRGAARLLRRGFRPTVVGRFAGVADVLYDRTASRRA